MHLKPISKKLTKMQIKNLFLAVIFSSFFVLQTVAQEMTAEPEIKQGISYSLQSGVGYFTNLFGFFEDDLGALPGSEPGQPGNILWSELSLILNNNSSIGIFLGYGRVNFTAYNRQYEFIAPSYIEDTYTLIALNFYRHFNFKRSTFSFGLGPQIQLNKSPRVEFDEVLIESGDEIYVAPYYFRTEYYEDRTLGLGLNLNYDFNINKHVSIGAKINTSFMMYYGIHDFIVSPFIKLGF